MKELKRFNNISKQLRDSLKVLEPGKHVEFQMTTGQPNLDPESNTKEPVVYPKVAIPPSDRIYDPYKKEYVEIGVFIGDDGELPTKFSNFIPGLIDSNGQVSPTAKFHGRFRLVGGRGNDDQWYAYLQLSNYSSTGVLENKDSTKQPICGVVDTLGDNKKLAANLDKKITALNVAKGFTKREAVDFADAMGLQWSGDTDVLRGLVADFADRHTEEFLRVISDPETKIKAILKQAYDAGVIGYDPSTQKVSYSKTSAVVAKLEMADGTPWIDGLADHLKLSAHGDKKLTAIKQQLKAVEENTPE